MSLETYLRAAPKAELHVHLEGSIQPATLLELARRNRVQLPTDTVEGLRDWFVFRDFRHFIDIYVAITSCLKAAEDYELIAYEFGAEMARQNVRYAEVTFSPSTHARLGIPHDTYFGGLTRGRERARADFGVEIAWVFDIVRGVLDPSERAARADYTTSVAIEDMAEGVVALGLGGEESGYPPARPASTASPTPARSSAPRASGAPSAPSAPNGSATASVRSRTRSSSSSWPNARFRSRSARPATSASASAPT
jgi:aminodeoxyfutalosine deaminase